jgi:hypothetical protein
VFGDRRWDKSRRQRPSPLNRRDTLTAVCLDRNGVSTAPKQPPQREHARRGRATRRLRGRAETQPQRHREQTTWLQSANPEAATHAFTAKAASPARRRRTRRPACRGEPSANRAATATNSWLLQRSAATTTPRALPRGLHRPADGPRSADRFGSGHTVPPRCCHRRGACPGQSCNGASHQPATTCHGDMSRTTASGPVGREANIAVCRSAGRVPNDRSVRPRWP